MQLVNHKAILNGSSTLILACCMGCSSAESSQPGEGANTTSSSQADDVDDHGHSVVEVDGALDDANNPVLRMEIEDGHMVTVYEPAPGTLIMTESLQRSHKAILTEYEQPDAIEVFARLRPGEAVPDALLAAYERAQESATLAAAAPQPEAEALQIHDPGGHPAIPARADLEPRADGLGVIRQAHSQSNPQDFVANHAGCDWAPRWTICRVNWGGGFHSGTGNANSMTSVVDHYAGNGVTVKLVVGAATTSLPQAVGTIVVYTGGLGLVGLFPRHMEILDAAGDSFHAGTRLF